MYTELSSCWDFNGTNCSDVTLVSRLSELKGFDVTSCDSESLISKDFGLN